MTRALPIALAVVAIVALTVVQGLSSQRWKNSEHAAYCASLLKDVPLQFGQWEGEDRDLDDRTRETAGATGYVSRAYTNTETGKTVVVWLILGHARDTARHTPDVCYRANGYEATESQSKQPLALGEGREASFFTNVFKFDSPTGGSDLARVFWTWFKPIEGSGEPVKWSAPDNVRYEIGAAPALYKLYFTVAGADAEAPVDKSLALGFAKEFIAMVDPLLSKANGEVPADFDPSTVNVEPMKVNTAPPISVPPAGESPESDSPAFEASPSDAL